MIIARVSVHPDLAPKRDTLQGSLKWALIEKQGYYEAQITSTIKEKRFISEEKYFEIEKFEPSRNIKSLAREIAYLIKHKHEHLLEPYMNRIPPELLRDIKTIPSYYLDTFYRYGAVFTTNGEYRFLYIKDSGSSSGNDSPTKAAIKYALEHNVSNIPELLEKIAEGKAKGQILKNTSYIKPLLVLNGKLVELDVEVRQLPGIVYLKGKSRRGARQSDTTPLTRRVTWRSSGP